MKQTIEHIQSKLKDALGVMQFENQYHGTGYRGEGGSEAEESGDDVKIKVPVSSDEDEEDEDGDQEMNPQEDGGVGQKKSLTSTNYVSTIKPVSFLDANESMPQMDQE